MTRYVTEGNLKISSEIQMYIYCKLVIGSNKFDLPADMIARANYLPKEQYVIINVFFYNEKDTYYFLVRKSTRRQILDTHLRIKY